MGKEVEAEEWERWVRRRDVMRVVVVVRTWRVLGGGFGVYARV
jgi:hypothetical protein